VSPTCGLWPGRRGLVGAVLDADGQLASVGTLPPHESETGLWLSQTEAHCGPGLELVLTEQLARHHPVSRLALDLGYLAWVAPPDLVKLISGAAWWRPTPRQLAAMLARLPRVRAARFMLRRLPLEPGPRQLRLF
jgi:hypothetical protein